MSDQITSPLRRNLARNILDLLRERGAAPGERLNRLALAEVLGVSRTPVNGAIALLKNLGVVRSEGGAVLLQTLDLDEEQLQPGGEERGVARLLVAIVRGRADGSVPDEGSERQLAQQFGVGRGVVA